MFYGVFAWLPQRNSKDGGVPIDDNKPSSVSTQCDQRPSSQLGRSSTAKHRVDAQSQNGELCIFNDPPIDAKDDHADVYRVLDRLRGELYKTPTGLPTKENSGDDEEVDALLFHDVGPPHWWEVDGGEFCLNPTRITTPSEDIPSPQVYQVLAKLANQIYWRRTLPRINILSPSPPIDMKPDNEPTRNAQGLKHSRTTRSEATDTVGVGIGIQQRSWNQVSEVTTADPYAYLFDREETPPEQRTFSEEWWEENFSSRCQ